MSRQKAVDYYLNKNTNNLNCAQAVISAFKEKFSLSEDSVGLFGSYGSGRAPGGECGAYYAAKFILNGKHQDKIRECEEMFLSHAGSTKCREVRQLNKLPCIGCIEKAAQFIEGLQKGVTMGPKEAYELADKDTTVRFLDVRNACEFNETHIKNSINIPLDILAGMAHELSLTKEKYIVLCRTGNRSAIAADILTQSGIASVRVLDGGMVRWQKEMLPVIEGDRTMSLERQVRVGAGSLVLFGILMSWFVHWAFIFISLFVGCGLIYAGITDNCMMGMLLMKLPYNKKRYQAKAGGGTCSIS